MKIKKYVSQQNLPQASLEARLSAYAALSTSYRAQPTAKRHSRPLSTTAKTLASLAPLAAGVLTPTIAQAQCGSPATIKP